MKNLIVRLENAIEGTLKFVNFIEIWDSASSVSGASFPTMLKKKQLIKIISLLN